MYKNLSFVAVIAICALLLSSCRATLSVIPQATNTIAPVTFDNLNLERKDYIVLNTISAEASVKAYYSDNEIRVEDPNGGFSMAWVKDKKTGVWSPDRIKGILRLGYIDHDYEIFDLEDIGPYPHWVVRRLATYKLINAAKMAGADGLIEPLISTNVEQGRNNREMILKTTVSAKIVKIKTDSK